VAELLISEEDAASLSQREAAYALVDIAVIHLPHLANFDEFGPLAAESGVQIRYVSRPEELRAPDLVIVPGSKATIPDLLWLHERGLARRICWLAQEGTPVLGVCGGYQMLGTAVHDPRRVESEQTTAPGLGLLSVETELTGAKRLVHTQGRALDRGVGAWRSVAGLPVEGYEIHLGRTTAQAGGGAFLDLEDGPEGSVAADAPVVGTHVHGLLERPEPRHALVQALADPAQARWRRLRRAVVLPLDSDVSRIIRALRGEPVGDLPGSLTVSPPPS